MSFFYCGSANFSNRFPMIFRQKPTTIIFNERKNRRIRRFYWDFRLKKPGQGQETGGFGRA
jgi:hypothetical protein